MSSRYYHRWTRPHFVRSTWGKDGEYRPVQECAECLTERNPFTRAITYRAPEASASCWRSVPPVNVASPEQLKAWEDEIRMTLEHIERSGETVAWDHGGKPATEPEPSFFDLGG